MVQGRRANRKNGRKVTTLTRLTVKRDHVQQQDQVLCIMRCVRGSATTRNFLRRVIMNTAVQSTDSVSPVCGSHRVHRHCCCCTAEKYSSIILEIILFVVLQNTMNMRVCNMRRDNDTALHTPHQRVDHPFGGRTRRCRLDPCRAPQYSGSQQWSRCLDSGPCSERRRKTQPPPNRPTTRPRRSAPS